MSPLTTPASDEIALRARVLELLAREGRSIHTGEIAAQLNVKTSDVHNAMHHAYQTGKVRFTSSEGWSLPPESGSSTSADDGQERLA